MKLKEIIRRVAVGAGIAMLTLAFVLTTTVPASAGPFKFLKKAKENYTVKIGGVPINKKEAKKKTDKMYAGPGAPGGSWAARNWQTLFIAGLFVTGTVIIIALRDSDKDENNNNPCLKSLGPVVPFNCVCCVDR